MSRSSDAESFELSSSPDEEQVPLSNEWEKEREEEVPAVVKPAEGMSARLLGFMAANTLATIGIVNTPKPIEIPTNNITTGLHEQTTIRQANVQTRTSHLCRFPLCCHGPDVVHHI
jgi:hypothetical protein